MGSFDPALHLLAGLSAATLTRSTVAGFDAEVVVATVTMAVVMGSVAESGSFARGGHP